MPNLGKLKRKDSSQIGVKDDSLFHRQKIFIRTNKQNSQDQEEPNAEKESKKSVLINNKTHINYSDESMKSHIQYRSGSAPKSSSSSNNMSGMGCNEKFRLTISYQNKTAKFNKFSNSFDLNGLEKSVVPNEILDEFSNSKNFPNRIWSWFSSQNYLSAEGDEEQKCLKNNSR